MYDLSNLPPISKVLKTDMQNLVFYTHYSQPKEDGVPETWLEACIRATNTLRTLSKGLMTDAEYQEIFEYIYKQMALPSMRLFSMPTKAVERDNSVIYNCSFIAIDDLMAFSEIMFLTMSGVGIGFSVESKVVEKLPEVPELSFGRSVFIIPDTQTGWAESVEMLFSSIFGVGEIPVFDYSKIRPAGSKLKTKGGASSGPHPLYKYHQQAIEILYNAQGRKLTTVEVYDLVTMIAKCAVSNGSRSGAMIALFDDDDDEMRAAKSSENMKDKPWRTFSNNSIVVNGSTEEQIDDIIQQLIYDFKGEPGLFSREKFYKQGRDDKGGTVGVNPCGEVLCRSMQFCNLSTIVARRKSFENNTLHEQVRVATLIGTIQSMATKFRYIRDDWKNNSEDERLLGVCATGVYDFKDEFTDELKEQLKNEAIHWNKVYAKRLGINPSTSVTSNKPSGNTSMLTNTSPGINPDFGRYQLRTVNVGKHSPIAGFLKSYNVELVENPYDKTGNRLLVSFPRKSRSEHTLQTATAEDQINNYLAWADIYTTHNASVTITYKMDEQEYIAEWIKDNYKHVTGMTFFPDDGADYEYAPVRLLSKEKYEELDLWQPTIKWEEYQSFGRHEVVPTVECSGDRCDVKF